MNTALKEYMVLFFALTIALIFLYSNDNIQIQTLRAWSLEGSGWIQDKITRYQQLWTIRQENIELQRKNAEYAFQIFQAQEALLENARLRALLKLSPPKSSRLIAATVIGTGLNRNIHTILINRGKKSGLSENMPVVTAKGLVGKLIIVSENFSYAHIIYDRYFRVSAKVQRTRENGIISWEHGIYCQFEQVPKRADVKNGDIIITSGFSSIFPKGVKIGTVVRTSEKTFGLFKEIDVKPAVDLTTLEEVLVITNAENQPGDK